MEPLDRNFAYVLFFNYGVRKLTKKQQKRVSSTQINGAMFEKSGFFSVPRRNKPNFLEFLRELHCYRAGRLKCTYPLDQN